MGSVKSKKGSHKRGYKATPSVDDDSPQPLESKRKLDDGTAAGDEQSSVELEQNQPVITEPAATDTPPAANTAPARSSSNQAAVSTASVTLQPPIPPHLAYLPVCPIRFSTFDCARKLRLSPSHLSIIGDKGYRTCRATHGLSAGSLYFELTYMPAPSAFTPHLTTTNAASASPSALSRLPPPALRVGFSTLQADIDGCVGMDRWGYGASSRGWRGHEGVWEEWEGGEWQAGDVIGVHLTLGAEEPRGRRTTADGGGDGAGGRTAGARSGRASRGKGRAGGKGRSGSKHSRVDLAAMYEKELQQRHERREHEREERERDKDKLPTAASATTASPVQPPASTSTAEQDKVSVLLSQQKATIFFLSSSLRYYRNGRPLSASPAFSTLFRGTYYPTVSLYMYAEVAVNFGPYFQHCPADVSGGWYDRRGVEVVEAEVEGGECGSGEMDEEEREERLRWAQEERMEELRDRGLLRQYAESEWTGLIDNSRHVQLRVEREREKEEEEREKERRQKEKEERERKERLEKEREKEMREQRDRERQAGSASRRGVNMTINAAAAAAVQEK